MRKISPILIALLLTLGLLHPVLAQETFLLADGSTIRVDGASNRSDWSVEATTWSGSFQVSDGVPVSGTMTIPVSDMKSGRSLIMDRLMHGTFEMDDHPNITFTLESAAPAEDGWWVMSGTLEMAAGSQPVAVRLQQQGPAGRTLRYTGSHELKMTDYGMTPPTAMFGSLHTRDEVTIHFDLLLASNCEENCASSGGSR
jgi:polyisoprenoid-binding protein YceI